MYSIKVCSARKNIGKSCNFLSFFGYGILNTMMRFILTLVLLVFTANVANASAILGCCPQKAIQETTKDASPCPNHKAPETTKKFAGCFCTVHCAPQAKIDIPPFSNRQVIDAIILHRSPALSVTSHIIRPDYPPPRA